MEITKWEYTTVRGDENANEMGKKGWEAYGIGTTGEVKLKRPCGRLKVIEKVNGVEINSTDNNYDTYER